MLFDCFISWLYMCVLKLTFEKNIFLQFFFSSFRFSVWSIRMDLLLHPDKHSLAICWPSSCHPDRISTGLRLASLSLPYTHLCIFIDLSWHLVCFSRWFLPRFWHFLHISFHPMIFNVFSVILLSLCDIGIFVGIFSWDSVHEHPSLSVCWADHDIFMPYE
jgi:hypothetical protein